MRETLADQVQDLERRSVAFEIVPTAEVDALALAFDRHGGELHVSAVTPLPGFVRVTALAAAFASTTDLEATVAYTGVGLNPFLCYEN